MTDSSHSSTQGPTHLRRQPKQDRGKARVEKILDAAAAVFDEVGYDATTTHQIAAKAGTAIGSLYQFFPNKAAIFNAMELRHVERVKEMWADAGTPAVIQLPLQQMIRVLVGACAELFANPISRIVFIQFFTANHMFQSIDEGMTQEAIQFLASILQRRNSGLLSDKCYLLAEVCVHSINAVLLTALRDPDLHHRQQLIEQCEALLLSYLEPYVGDNASHYVMKVMTCPHCKSDRLSKNGWRRGKQCYLCKDCRRQFVESVMQ